MSNPARELHGLYLIWREGAVSANKPLSSIVSPIDVGSQDVVAVARLLTRIDEVLVNLEEAGANVALYRRQYPGWWAPLRKIDAPANVGPEQVLSGAALDQIEGLANFLDGKVFVLESVHEESLRSLVQRVRDGLTADDELDGELRWYILRLVQSIELALDDEAIGRGFDTAEATRQLWVALRAAEGAGTGKSGFWRDLWLQMTAGTLAGTAVEVGKVTIAAITGIS